MSTHRESASGRSNRLPRPQAALGRGWGRHLAGRLASRLRFKPFRQQAEAGLRFPASTGQEIDPPPGRHSENKPYPIITKSRSPVPGGDGPVRWSLTGATDPRWVLAVRVAEQLQGDLLTPDRRERLLRVGTTLGLSPFSVNIIIAIVQDQARRGYVLRDDLQAGAWLLEIVPPPDPHRPSPRGRWALMMAWLVSSMILLELLVVRWLIGG